MKQVRIIVTGGTIDKVHDPATEALAFPIDRSTRIAEILSHGRCFFPHVEQLIQKDSLEFIDADRDLILGAVLAAKETAIVVTHGTGTMGQTARWISNKVPGKTVVLTGAMRPQSLGISDGPFNVGGALIAAQLLPEGVYGVMNGRVIEAAQLVKNTEFGRFDI